MRPMTRVRKCSKRKLSQRCVILLAGELLWRTDVGAPIFTPLSLLPGRRPLHVDPPPPLQPCRSLGAIAEQLGTAGGDAAGPPPASQRQAAAAAAAESTVVTADQAGRILGMCLRCGAVLWSHTVNGGGGGGRGCGTVSIRASPVAPPPPLLPPLPPAAPAGVKMLALPFDLERRIAWTAGPGAVGIVRLPNTGGHHCGGVAAPAGSEPQAAAAVAAVAAVVADPAGSVPREDDSHTSSVSDGLGGTPARGVDQGLDCRAVAAAQLPAEVFNVPVAFGGLLVVGCRDDFLYCLAQT